MGVVKYNIAPVEVCRHHLEKNWRNIEPELKLLNLFLRAFRLRRWETLCIRGHFGTNNSDKKTDRRTIEKEHVVHLLAKKKDTSIRLKSTALLKYNLPKCMMHNLSLMNSVVPHLHVRFGVGTEFHSLHVGGTRYNLRTASNGNKICIIKDSCVSRFRKQSEVGFICTKQMSFSNQEWTTILACNTFLWRMLLFISHLFTHLFHCNLMPQLFRTNLNSTTVPKKR